MSRAAADDHELVGGVLHLAHQVAGDEDGAALGGQPADQLADPVHAFGVEAVDRLVEQQHLRVAQQRAGDAEPLAHAQRERAARRRGDLGEPDGVRAPRPRGTRDAVAAGHRQQVVAGGAAGVDRSASSSAPTSRSGCSRSAYARPSIRAVPDVGGSRPRIIRMVVDLPAPFGPRNPVTCPARMSTDRPYTAVLVPYVLVSRAR